MLWRDIPLPLRGYVAGNDLLFGTKRGDVEIGTFESHPHHGGNRRRGSRRRRPLVGGQSGFQCLQRNILRPDSRGDMSGMPALHLFRGGIGQIALLQLCEALREPFFVRGSWQGVVCFTGGMLWPDGVSWPWIGIIRSGVARRRRRARFDGGIPVHATTLGEPEPLVACPVASKGGACVALVKVNRKTTAHRPIANTNATLILTMSRRRRMSFASARELYCAGTMGHTNMLLVAVRARRNRHRRSSNGGARATRACSASSARWIASARASGPWFQEPSST